MPTASPKAALATMAFPLSRFLVRRVLPLPLANSFWRSIVRPRLQWRSHPSLLKSCYGATLEGDTKDLIPLMIYFCGIWEPHISEYLRTKLRPGDVFIDVGANLGWYTLLASDLVGPRGRVVAIEASSNNLARLERNLQLNDAQNVDAVHAAVWQREDTLTLFEGPDWNKGATSVDHACSSSRDSAQVEKVSARPLAALVPEDLLRRAAFVKIDVEGAEWEVIQGMKETLRLFPQNVEFLLEVSPEALARKGFTPDQLLQPFLDLGFHAYSIRNDYSPECYLEFCRRHIPERPRRVREPIQRQCDLILSRVDAGSL